MCGTGFDERNYLGIHSWQWILTDLSERGEPNDLPSSAEGVRFAEIVSRLPERPKKLLALQEVKISIHRQPEPSPS